jgi:hypothetical protein
MEMEKPIRVAVSTPKSELQVAKTINNIKRIKTITYIFLNNGMIIAEK